MLYNIYYNGTPVTKYILFPETLYPVIIFCVLQLIQSYEERDRAIKYCLTTVSDSVENLKAKRQSDPDNIDVVKSLRKEQTKVK